MVNVNVDCKLVNGKIKMGKRLWITAGNRYEALKEFNLQDTKPEKITRMGSAIYEIYTVLGITLIIKKYV